MASITFLFVWTEGEASSVTGLPDVQPSGDFYGDSKSASFYTSKILSPWLAFLKGNPFFFYSNHLEKHCSSNHGGSHFDSTGPVRQFVSQ